MGAGEPVAAAGHQADEQQGQGDPKGEHHRQKQDEKGHGGELPAVLPDLQHGAGAEYVAHRPQSLPDLLPEGVAAVGAVPLLPRPAPVVGSGGSGGGMGARPGGVGPPAAGPEPALPLQFDEGVQQIAVAALQQVPGLLIGETALLPQALYLFQCDLHAAALLSPLSFSHSIRYQGRKGI